MNDIDAEIQALMEEEARAAGRVMAAVEDARAVLRDDLPRFVEREVKRCFIGSPEFSAGLSDDDVAAIKAEIREEGAAAAEEILTALADEAPWLAGVAHAGEAEGSFEDNPELWTVVNRIVATPEAILRRHGFPEPDGGFALAYRQPTWFVAGRHMRTVSEHYWRGIREMGELGRRREEIDAGRREAELKARWDAI